MRSSSHLVLREQLEHSLHRPAEEWPSQPFQVTHGAAGQMAKKFSQSEE
jgi:hypothetical protein